MSGEPVLEVRDLRVAYGRVAAVQGLSLSLRQGQIAAVLGANGAGKSTLLNAIMGLLPCTGEISFPNTRNARLSTEARVKAGISLVPESRDLFGAMTVEDNLLLGFFARRHEGRAGFLTSLSEVHARFPRLKERNKQLANTLSGGERQMLALGRALMGRPRILLLDEPSLGLSPALALEMIQMVSALRDLGISILLVEQNARAALAVANYAYVLETGSLVLEGPAAEVASNSKVVDSYLGTERAPENATDAGAAQPAASRHKIEPHLRPARL